jgi:hypothetical protein
VDNSTRLKELQVVSGVFFFKCEGLENLFLFQKGFFWVRKGGWINSTLF